MFFDRRSVLDGVKNTNQNISARSLTLLIFAVGWALCGRPQPEYESVMPLLSLYPLISPLINTLSSVTFCKSYA